MTRPTAFTTPIVALALISLLWLSSLAPALAATVTDTFRLNATGKDWCRSDPKFFDAFNVKAAQGMTITFTRDVLNTGDSTDIQATINNSGNATIDAMTLNGRALLVNKLDSIAQLVLSGRDPGHPDHFFTLRGTATLNKAGKLTKVTGKFVYQILSGLGGAPNIDCFGSGTFVTGKTPGLPDWARAKFEAYVKASNTEKSDNFGAFVAAGSDILHSVALDGDTLVVGAAREDSNAIGGEDNNSAADSGAVYVFTRTGETWTQQAYVKALNTGQSDHFGTSVALSGDTLAVGAYKEDSSAIGVNEVGGQDKNDATDSGAVYVYRAPPSERVCTVVWMKAGCVLILL